MTKDEREAMAILNWLFTLGQSPVIPHQIFWHYRGIHWTPRLEQRNLKLMEYLLKAGADANSISLCYDNSYNDSYNDSDNDTDDSSKSIPQIILEVILDSKRSNDVVFNIAKLLFKHDASVNLDQALLSAIRTKRSIYLIELILENGGNLCAGLDCPSGFVYKETALSAAAAVGISETQYILNLLATWNKSKSIATFITADVFISAASAGQNDTIRFLYGQSSIIAANNFGITPLHAAAYNGYLSTCQILVPLQGAHVLDFTPMYSPLHFACYNCHQDVIQFLISHKVPMSSYCQGWPHQEGIESREAISRETRGISYHSKKP